MISIINNFISFISILISVAFFTLLERKILSYMQIRKGPNKTSLMGILQPISDAIKLFNKSFISTSSSNMTLMMMSPIMALLLSLIMLLILPFKLTTHLDTHFNILSFLFISSMLIYPILLTGWSMNSKYSNLGTIRNMAQMISYEINLFLIILSVIILTNTFNMISFKINMWILTLTLMNLTLWLISCMAETNRTPFDFAEGESELVSGFNVEYMGSLFAFIFLAEYMNMIILSIITATMFSINSLLIIMSTIIIFLWIRSTLPRFRFDLLMKLNWKIMLPLSINMMILYSLIPNMTS